MNAHDVMSSPAITVTSRASVREITTLLREHHIGAVPVVEGGELIGMVCASDLLHRCYEAQACSAHARPWWSWLIHRSAPPLQYVRSHGTRAEDIMTRHAVSVTERTSLADIAALLSAHRIHSVPVVCGRRVVGIVTSADLVQALLDAEIAQPDQPCSDREIRAKLVAELAHQEWWNPEWSSVSVDQGIVKYEGMIESEPAREAARVAAECTPGVREVVDKRIWIAQFQTMA